MNRRFGRWLLGVLLLVLMGGMFVPTADAQRRYRRRYHRRHHHAYRHPYRRGHR